MSNDFSGWSRPALESLIRATIAQRDEAIEAADASQREVERLRHELGTRVRYWDADFNEISRDEAIQKGRAA